MAGGIPPLLADMAVVLAVAGVTTLLFNRLKQPTVLGYLLAGLIVGPFTWGGAFVQDAGTVRLLGDLGVIFLLFALGLEFNLRKLRKVGATALVSGTLQVALMIWLGYLVGRAFGLPPLGAIFLGSIVSISSTVIIVKVVGERGQQDQEWAQVVFGILIIEDILAVLMLTLLSAAGGAEALTPSAVGFLLGKFALFIVGALVLGLLVVPRFITYVAGLDLEDVLVVTAIALGFGLAILGGVLGFSPALGAFLMGALIAESSAHHKVEALIAPVRDLFTAIFFVTVGMLVDPRAIVEHAPLILAVTAAVIGGKIIAGTFATFVTGRDPTTSLRVGFGLAQVGEFSFILAALAVSVGATDAPLYVVSVSAAAITTFTTPYLIEAAPRFARTLDRVAPRSLRTYVTLYSAWTRRLYEGGGSDPRRRDAIRAAVRTGFFGAAAIAVIVAGGASVRVLGHALGDLFAARRFADLLAWVAVGIASLPFLVLYSRAQGHLSRLLADLALPSRLARRKDAPAVRAILSSTFFLAGLAVAATVFLVFASPLLPAGPILLLVAGSLVVAAFPLYRAILRFQTRVDTALEGVLGDPDATPAAVLDRHHEVLDQMRIEHR